MRDELEIEKQLRSRLEKELKEAQDAHEEDKNRHKNIVLLLLTERKKIIRQFIEERKRSADLSVMLEEEKRQALAMAEGLEEESQKVNNLLLLIVNREVRVREFLRLLPVNLPGGFMGVFTTVIF